jgi:hypothetical protein
MKVVVQTKQFGGCRWVNGFLKIQKVMAAHQLHSHNLHQYCRRNQIYRSHNTLEIKVISNQQHGKILDSQNGTHA